MYDMSGFNLEGTWQNPNNGDVCVVCDYFMDDSGSLFVTTRDGRTFDYNRIQDYVKISDEKMSEQQVKKIKGQKMVDDKPAPVSKNVSLTEGMLPEDIALITNTQTPTNTPPQPAPAPQQNAPLSSTQSIIDKAFKNKVEAPDVFLQWKNYPSKQIELLTDIMDVSLEEIAEYIYNNYIDNKEVMVEKIKQSLLNK